MSLFASKDGTGAASTQTMVHKARRSLRVQFDQRLQLGTRQRSSAVEASSAAAEQLAADTVDETHHLDRCRRPRFDSY